MLAAQTESFMHLLHLVLTADPLRGPLCPVRFLILLLNLHFKVGRGLQLMKVIRDLLFVEI
jgi:hypothetical protein